ncbi:MAG: hypothetical protein QXQ33_00760 [Nitrososphaerota archaeon]
MKKIYWVSRHFPTKSQVEALKQLFNDDIHLVIDPNPFSSAEAVVNRYKSSGCHDILVVAPLSVIQKMTEMGVFPLWSEMKQCTKEEAEVEVNGRFYKFVRFRRIKGVKIEFEDV